jgi:hypothetical protein
MLQQWEIARDWRITMPSSRWIQWALTFQSEFSHLWGTPQSWPSCSGRTRQICSKHWAWYCLGRGKCEKLSAATSAMIRSRLTGQNWFRPASRQQLRSRSAEPSERRSSLLIARWRASTGVQWMYASGERKTLRDLESKHIHWSAHKAATIPPIRAD